MVNMIHITRDQLKTCCERNDRISGIREELGISYPSIRKLMIQFNIPWVKIKTKRRKDLLLKTATEIKAQSYKMLAEHLNISSICRDVQRLRIKKDLRRIFAESRKEKRRADFIKTAMACKATTLKELGDYLHCTRQNVSAKAHSLGISKEMKGIFSQFKPPKPPKPPKSPRPSKVTKEQLEALCAKNLTIKELAEELGICVMTVQRYIRKYAIQRIDVRKIWRLR